VRLKKKSPTAPPIKYPAASTNTAAAIVVVAASDEYPRSVSR
jgi:hypothetical protein